MDNLSKLKIELKHLLADGLDIALKHIGEKMSPDSTKYNEFVQQKSRYAAYLSAIMMGGSSKAELDQVYNAISHACLLLVDSLTINDLKQDAVPSAAAHSKRGELLYHIPHAMEVNKEHACRVRVAYLLDIIFDGWKKQEEEVNRQIRIAEIMSVELMNVGEKQPFAIRAMTETVQFLESDDYTEWLFYVRPLRHGEFPLLLKVSVLEVINGREVKKDVVIEEHVIVSNEVQEETPVLKKSGVEVSLQHPSATLTDSPYPNSGEQTNEPILMKRLRRAARPLALFLAFLMFSTAGLYATTTQYTRGYLWARVQNSEQAYLEFIEKYKSTPAFQAAPEREKAYFRLAKVSEDPLLVREYIQVLDSSVVISSHLAMVAEKLKALELKEVQLIDANPTQQLVEYYVTRFPEMNLLPKVVEIVNKRADLSATALPILEKAAVRQISNPNVHPVQIKMYQTLLPASQPALQNELGKRPALKAEVEQVEYKGSDSQDEQFFYTKQDYRKAGKSSEGTGAEGKNTTDSNVGGNNEPDHIAQQPADRDSDGIPDLNDRCPDEAGDARWQGCPDTDADGIPDQEDACPTQKGTAADKGCPAADRDSDGVPDLNDQCPDKAGEARWEGCPDIDGDGIPDHEDACPTQKGVAADNGCPAADGDSDGVPDQMDQCPDKAGDVRWRGCPDSDGDGIPDPEDACPTQKGTVADKGCPAVEPALPGYDMVLVRGGTFPMGCTSEQQDCSDDENPALVVTVSDFYIGKYEVTQKQWRDIMGDNPSYFKGCDQCPVENVSWDDIQDFLQKLNKKHPGKNYRLPTEAEWEYAARGGGKATMFGNGKNVADPLEINFNGSVAYKKSYSLAGIYREKTIPVGSLNSPNALGLHDMSGNVWEWCSDWYGSDYYKNSPSNNPQGPPSGSYRVLRGGSWSGDPQYCRVANRSDDTPGYRGDGLGFRLARTK